MPRYTVSLYLEESPLAILEIRKMTEKKGCQITLWVVMGLIGLGLVGTGLFQSLNAGNEMNQKVVAFTVSGKEITVEEYSNRLSLATQQIQQNQMAALQLQFGGPTAQLDLIGNTLDQMIRQSLVSTIAAQNNIQVTEDAARKAWEVQVETEIQNLRNQLISSDPSLAADEAKYNEAFAAQTGGQSPAELRKTAMEQFAEEIKGENRQTLMDSFIGPVVVDYYTKQSQKTEADVKASYDTYFVNRLALSDPEKSSDEMLTKAEEARAALVGGTAYADVYKKYVPNTDTVPEPVEYTRGTIDQNEPLEPLLSLEKGQVSQPINEGGAWVIYQIVKIENKLPADYEARKEQLLVDARRNDAAEVLNTKIEGMMDSAVKWESVSLKAAYDTYLLLTVNQADITNEKLNDLVSQADTAMGDSVIGSTPAVYAKYAALNALVSRATPSQKEELMPQWIEVHQQVLGVMESATLRTALADLYFESDQGELGAATLIEALDNIPVEDTMGEFTVQEIEAKLKDEETAKKIPAEMKEQLEAKIAAWRADLAAYQKEMEEVQKAQEAEMEQLNKEMEEQAKKDAAAATGGDSGATTGTTGDAGTTGSTPEAPTTDGDKPEGQ